MEKIKKLLGKRIKELRLAKGVSQQQLAEKSNIDQRSLSHIECGDTFPSKALLDISKALDVELKDLFDYEHHKLNIEEMKDFIAKNLSQLTDENIKILYRLIKSMQ